MAAVPTHRRWNAGQSLQEPDVPKNAYNPAVLVKLLEVFRTYFNYCEVGQDKKTPAMRMGLARGPVAPEDILYFEPAAPAGQRRRAPRKAPAVTTETSVSP